jgi:endoglucanase
MSTRVVASIRTERFMRARAFIVQVAATVLTVAAVQGPAVAVAPSVDGPTPAGSALAASWTAPLSTVGRYIVDADGRRFKLKSGNWHGGSGTWDGSGDASDPAHNHAGEVANQIPLGLDRAPIATILASFHELGINSIRLQFSNEMIHDGLPVSDAAVAANPALRGNTPLQVFDAVVRALTVEGFAVVLNNHTTTSRWCCGLDGNERWNTNQTVEQWESDWLAMVRRYADNPRVVGADLYNEVRRNVLDDPNWGGGDSRDWWAASGHLADSILTEANPDLLIVIEGINWTGVPVDFLPHGRPDLQPVRQLSHTLVRSHKLVYAAHFYGYTGPHHSGATGTGETHDLRYQDMDRTQLFDNLRAQAFFVTQDPPGHYTAPLWISEFGVGGRDVTDARTRQWFTNFVDYLIATDADFAYWPLVGWHENRQGNGWALMSWDAGGGRMGLYDGDDWRAGDWRRLVSAPAFTGPVEPTRSWHMLSVDHADENQSLHMRALPDWDTGARKAVCPDGELLAGLSHTGNRELCTDGPLQWGDRAPTVVRGEMYVDTDWASGYTKLQCPARSAAVGYSVRGADLSGLLCAPADAAVSGGGRIVWFDRGDNRPDGGPGGEFAAGRYKGQCGADEYVAGVAYSSRLTSPGKEPDALLCRHLA